MVVLGWWAINVRAGLPITQQDHGGAVMKVKSSQMALQAQHRAESMHAVNERWQWQAGRPAVDVLPLDARSWAEKNLELACRIAPEVPEVVVGQHVAAGLFGL